MLLTALSTEPKPSRPYQRDRIGSAVSLLKVRRSPIIQMATGTGKTHVGSRIISLGNEIFGREDFGALWFVHRRELVYQARDAIEEATGQEVGLEMGSERSGGRRIVVASKDTIRRVNRLATLYRPDLLVIDECHHAEAESYLTICQAFPTALRIGLSATPFRMDRKSLSVFDAATEPYGIREGIKDGWLVPLEAFRIKAKSIDISNVRAVAGDLSEHDMALVVQQDSAVAEITQGVLENYERRPTVLFAPDVKSATLLCNDLNSRAGWSVARVVTQETSNDARAIAFRTFGDDYLILVNVGVATEGVDLPRAEVIALARLTLSQALYIQMVGRGLRPLPGIDDAADRHAWIAASSKRRCLVLDFVGNVGKHSIASAAAMFGDKSMDEAAMAAIVAKVGHDIESAGRPISVLDAIEAEERSQLKKLAGEIESDKIRDKIQGKPNVTLSVEVADVLGLVTEGYDASAEPATIGQLEQLVSFGSLVANTDGTPITRAEAASKIALQRAARALASPKQIEFVQKHYKKLDLDAQALAMLTKKDAQKMIVKKLKAWGQAR